MCDQCWAGGGGGGCAVGGATVGCVSVRVHIRGGAPVVGGTKVAVLDTGLTLGTMVAVLLIHTCFTTVRVIDACALFNTSVRVLLSRGAGGGCGVDGGAVVGCGVDGGTVVGCGVDGCGVDGGTGALCDTV